MRTLFSPVQLQKICLQLKRRGKNIGVVPTMGYLHDGHVALMKKAKAQCDVVVLTIFVNPTQFGPKEDLSRYPRDLKGDLAKAKKAGVDFVFTPQVKNLYPENYQTYVQVEEATRELCGASRPTHFRGVTTIVAKLFNVIQPDKAFFGLKDYQQYAVICRMVQDLNFPIKIVGVPTVREKDGLAMSSRNVYLNSEERQAALCLSQSLQAAALAVKKGKKGLDDLQNIIVQTLKAQPLARIDYVKAVHCETMVPLKNYIPKKTLFALAVFIGTTRLIDNRVL